MNTAIFEKSENSDIIEKFDIFYFEKGDVVSFCDEEFYVIENNGSTGVVNPIGDTYYLRNFYWKYKDTVTTFVRKPTQEELRKLGFL